MAKFNLKKRKIVFPTLDEPHPLHGRVKNKVETKPMIRYDHNAWKEEVEHVESDHNSSQNTESNKAGKELSEASIASFLYKFLQRNETKQIRALQEKANKNSIPFELIEEVYNKGLIEYSNLIEETLTADQWAFNRVNQYIQQLNEGLGRYEELEKQYKGIAIRYKGRVYEGTHDQGHAELVTIHLPHLYAKPGFALDYNEGTNPNKIHAGFKTHDGQFKLYGTAVHPIREKEREETRANIAAYKAKKALKENLIPHETMSALERKANDWKAPDPTQKIYKNIAVKYNGLVRTADKGMMNHNDIVNKHFPHAEFNSYNNTSRSGTAVHGYTTHQDEFHAVAKAKTVLEKAGHNPDYEMSYMHRANFLKKPIYASESTTQTNEQMIETNGAGFQGTDRLASTYESQTPGQKGKKIKVRFYEDKFIKEAYKEGDKIIMGNKAQWAEKPKDGVGSKWISNDAKNYHDKAHKEKKNPAGCSHCRAEELKESTWYNFDHCGKSYSSRTNSQNCPSCKKGMEGKKVEKPNNLKEDFAVGNWMQIGVSSDLQQDQPHPLTTKKVKKKLSKNVINLHPSLKQVW